jgi:hypothetical protein
MRAGAVVVASARGTGQTRATVDREDHIHVAVTMRQQSPSRRMALVALLLVGAGVALCLGVYARVHSPAGRPVFTLGFSGMLQMKAWLTTVAACFLIVQLFSALWMYGKLGRGNAPAWVSPVHRWSGAIAFVITLPVAFSCIWSLGFATTSARVVIHGVAGCMFYGAYAAKMLGLRMKNTPGWVIPVLGGSLLALMTVLWLTAALWFFTRPGLPLT